MANLAVLRESLDLLEWDVRPPQPYRIHHPYQTRPAPVETREGCIPAEPTHTAMRQEHYQYLLASKGKAPHSCHLTSSLRGSHHPPELRRQRRHTIPIRSSIVAQSNAAVRLDHALSRFATPHAPALRVGPLSHTSPTSSCAARRRWTRRREGQWAAPWRLQLLQKPTRRRAARRAAGSAAACRPCTQCGASSNGSRRSTARHPTSKWCV
mmetsp:Transcript_9456/g.22744  ORF Transcript_9456/g.22744 Transcript_9456/m.22744 type:complete len:210 (+) Transcript_9456:46-675(+)